MNALNVFWDRDHVGTLARVGARDLAFEYAPSYLDLPDAAPISVALPLQAGPFAPALSTAWFTNLLPEGEVRGHVARRLGVSERNDFGLLEGLGGECAGALSLVPEGVSPPPVDASTRRPLTWSQLEETVNRTPRPSLLALMLSEPELRLSLAGAQDKLPVCLIGDDLGLPVGGAPSTHLLKVASAAFPGLVANELFCLELARRVGLPVPAARLAPTETPMLLIERYDRAIAGDRSVTRLHQEDLCQALGVGPESKYENEGGPGLTGVFDLVTRVSRQPLIDRRLLLSWVLLNHLIGNADAHGKNLSLLHGARRGGGAPVLAPFYDLVCTAVYPELSPRQAMKVGGEARRDRVATRHWVRFAESVGVRPTFLRRTGDDLCRAVETAVPEIGDEHGDNPITAAIAVLISKQVRQLRAELARVDDPGRNGR